MICIALWRAACFDSHVSFNILNLSIKVLLAVSQKLLSVQCTFRNTRSECQPILSISPLTLKMPLIRPSSYPCLLCPPPFESLESPWIHRPCLSCLHSGRMESIICLEKNTENIFVVLSTSAWEMICQNPVLLFGIWVNTVCCQSWK